MSSEARPARVLIVEDETSQRIMLIAIAREFCSAVGASSAAEALALLAAEPFDLVLTDHEIGRGMSGTALLDQVAARWPATRRCLMSASDRQTSHAFLSKPIDFAELRDVLRMA